MALWRLLLTLLLIGAEAVAASSGYMLKWVDGDTQPTSAVVVRTRRENGRVGYLALRSDRPVPPDLPRPPKSRYCCWMS